MSTYWGYDKQVSNVVLNLVFKRGRFHLDLKSNFRLILISRLSMQHSWIMPSLVLYQSEQFSVMSRLQDVRLF